MCMLRQIYRSRAARWIGVIGIALLLLAGVAAFAHQSGAAHAQMPGQKLATGEHASSTRGCSSVDSISNGDLDVALDQCGDTGSMFKATVIDWGATSTSIKAGLQGHGMPYMNRCKNFACST